MDADHEIRRYRDPDFPFSAWVSRDLEFMAHWHHEVEIVLVLEGQLTMGVNQKEMVLVPGDIGVSASQDIHYYRRGASQIVVVIVHPDLVPRGAGWLVAPQDHGLDRRFRDQGAAELLVAIAREVEAQDQDWKAAVLGHTQALSALVGRHLFPPTATAAPPPGHQRMQKALAYLQEHFREDLTLEAVAREVALSPWAFSHRFSSTAGRNFRAYLNGLRVREARRLLADPHRKVIDVALDCGFTSLRSFNRAYRDETGTTPRPRSGASARQ